MVSDGQVSPVGLESVGRSSEHASNVVSVVFGRVEVSVVSYENRHSHLDVLSFMHSRLDHILKLSIREDLLERSTNFLSDGRSHTGKIVEVLIGEDSLG